MRQRSRLVSRSSRLIIMISLRELQILVGHRAIAILVTRPHRHRRRHRRHIFFLQTYYYFRDEPLETTDRVFTILG